MKKNILFLTLLAVAIFSISCSLGLIDPDVSFERNEIVDGLFNKDEEGEDDSNSGGDSTEGGEQEDVDLDELIAQETLKNTEAFLDNISNRYGSANVYVSTVKMTIEGTGELDETGETFDIVVPKIGYATYKFYKLVTYNDCTKAYYKKVSSTIKLEGVYAWVSGLLKPMVEDLLTEYYGIEIIAENEQKLYVYKSDTVDNIDFDVHSQSLDMALVKK